MILSYSFDVNYFRWTFFFFNFDVFILKLYYNGAFFYFIFTLYPYWIFVKRDKLLSKKIKSKYENIKLKRKESQAEGAQHLNYRIKS
jgi:hypothetical protein